MAKLIVEINIPMVNYDTLVRKVEDQLLTGTAMRTGTR